MHGNRYLPTLFLSTVVFVCAVLAFNLLVDPFGLEIVRPPFNFHKPDLASYNRIYKAFALLRIRPKTVILGTSRTEFGIDPDHPGFGREATPVYNLSLNGTTMAEMHDALACAIRVAQVRRVVIGLDFYNFNAYRELRERHRKFNCVETKIAGIKEYLSLSALIASAKAIGKTLLLAYRGEKWDVQPILPNGLENAELQFTNKVPLLGHRSMFLAIERDNLAIGYKFHPSWRYSFEEEVTGSTLEAFGRVIALARQANVEVHPFLSPSHARDWETIRLVGLWSEFESWKRELVAVLEKDAASNPSHKPVVLWDFAGYSSVSTEKVPVANDTTTHMRWYWESAHYKKELGDLVLDRVWSYQDKSRQWPADLGVPLSAGNVEMRIAAVREDQRRYHQSHGSDILELENLARSLPKPSR